MTSPSTPGAPHTTPHTAPPGAPPGAPVSPRPPVFTKDAEGLGPLTVTPLDPAVDSPLVHGWVTQERARFWGMGGAGPDLVREIYEDVDRRTTHHAFLVRLDGRPVALFQTYDPAEDRISECYDVLPGDIGMHILLAPAEGPAVSGFSVRLMRVLLEFALSGGRARVVAEPDAADDRAVALLTRLGFEAGPEIELPEIDLPEVYLPAKRARLCILTPHTPHHP